jgi:diguanylate cyclase (GGDEF)-like protein/PAS domain S-box-containing protein
MVMTLANTTCCKYESYQQLNSFVKENELDTFPSLFVQVFSGHTNKALIEEVQHSLLRLLPAANIIGCTTAGEINNGTLSEREVVLSFTSFEKTRLSTMLLNQSEFENSYEMGKALATQTFTFDTKAIIIFPSYHHVDSQELIEGIYEINPEVIISGGIAADNENFEGTYVFTEKEMTSGGVVAAVLNSAHLQIDAYTNSKWQEIGKSITVTKADGNTIYSINKKKPLHILKQYLGETFTKQLPNSGVEFPFLMEIDGEKSSVFISKVLKTGEIEVTRKMPEGTQLTFAYADTRLIIEDSLLNMKRLSKKPIESIFVYNCMARKRFMNDFTKEELKMIQSIAPTSGFFASGEISVQSGRIPRIIGHSLTYLAISESMATAERNARTFDYEIPSQMKTIMSLTHLMQASHYDMQILNENLMTSEQYYRSLFDNNADFVYSTDLHGHFTSVNPAFEKTFGFKKKDIIGKPATNFIKPDDIPRAKAHFLRTIKGKEQYYNIEIPTANEEVQVFQVKNIPITVNGVTAGVYGIGHNITKQKKTEEKIRQLAYYDIDTGLPNRMLFTEQLTKMLKRAKKKKDMLAVLFIDLDRFKIINDSLGHFAGDSIIKELVDRIQGVLPTGAFFGRFGGDKFSLLLTKNGSVDEVINVAKSIISHIARSVLYENQEFFVTASIGVSLYPNDGQDEQVLLKNADIAMNRSMIHGGNRITFFSTEMNDEAVIRLELESFLRKALQKNEFYLCYQPLIDLSSGSVFGSEALIRWEHPRLGLVSPADFIPLAEETGLIEEIGLWVLQTACFQNKKWQEMGFANLSIAVNVSAHQFQLPNFIMDVKQSLVESGLEPHFLTLELTESAMLRNIENSIGIMNSLQEMGVKVSIDDFGTGYSSLSYLRNLPINTLKIDRSFIHNLRNDTADIAIVKAIITMGHGLSVKVVAEGVETKEQIELLRELNCHYAQGFYLNKPLMIEEFENDLSSKGEAFSG